MQKNNLNLPSEIDRFWMEQALKLAEYSETQNEVPVGAIVVFNEEVMGEGWNCPISTADPTAHAEIIALRQAAKKIGNYRLPDMTLYVTLEPCIMCVGAMIHARIKRLVFGTNDPKTGAVISIANLLNHPQLNHKIDYMDGVLADKCQALLSTFFKKRRSPLHKKL